MGKYRLIDVREQNTEHLCDKVTIDGFDYYVSGEIIKDVRQYKGKWQIEKGYILNKFPTYLTDLSDCRLITATTNPNIDIPKVVDEVERMAFDFYENVKKEYYSNVGQKVQLPKTNKEFQAMGDGFIVGYNKSQETHPFNEKDVRFMLSEAFKASQEGYQITTDEIIQIWKEQQPKKVYYDK